MCNQTMPSCSHADVSMEVEDNGVDNGDAIIKDEPTIVVRETIQTTQRTSVVPSKLPMTKEVREKCLEIAEASRPFGKNIDWIGTAFPPFQRLGMTEEQCEQFKTHYKNMKQRKKASVQPLAAGGSSDVREKQNLANPTPRLDDGAQGCPVVLENFEELHYTEPRGEMQ